MTGGSVLSGLSTLSNAIINNLRRAAIKPEDTPYMTDQEILKLRNFGREKLVALRRAYPSKRPVTSIYTPEEWRRLAELAEKIGLEGERLSTLARLVVEGKLPSPRRVL